MLANWRSQTKDRNSFTLRIEHAKFEKNSFYIAGPNRTGNGHTL